MIEGEIVFNKTPLGTDEILRRTVGLPSDLRSLLMLIRRAVLAIPAAFGSHTMLTGCAAEAQALPHDAYIWQRQWSDALRAQVQIKSRWFAALRVLVAQRLRDGRWVHIAVDRSVLQAHAAQRWSAVLRIDGSSLDLSAQEVLVRMAELRAALQLPELAFEIDFDCATSRLSEYAQLLRLIAATQGKKAAITALPSWLDSAELSGLLQSCSHVTLQVHAVRNPR
jgi:hypothetical protein